MYNRASADPDGKPWSERKKIHVLGRQGRPEQQGAWVGPDKPDFSPDKPPDYEPDSAADLRLEWMRMMAGRRS